MPFRRVFLLLVLALPCLLKAQEVRYIDLTVVRQRTELRHPPAPPSDCRVGAGCLGGGYGGGSQGGGAAHPARPPRPRMLPHALYTPRHKTTAAVSRHFHNFNHTTVAP